MEIFNSFHELEINVSMNIPIPKELMNQQKYGLSFIPAAVYTNFLIDYYKYKTNPIYLDNEHIEIFTKEWGISKDIIKRHLKQLCKKNFITLTKKKFTYSEIFNRLNVKNSLTGCLFCGYNKTYLDKHHYPIPRSKGGTETINLCPNCHREFHTFTSCLLYEIKLNEKFLQKFSIIAKQSYEYASYDGDYLLSLLNLSKKGEL